MDEVDRIIVHSLKQIGCDIEEDVECLRQFTTEIVVEAVVRCIQLIKPGFEMSHHLPPGMTPRFRIGSALAQACSDLGYSGEIGYQTFLYWSESDIRRVLMFLIEKLPKETEKTSNEPLGASTLLNHKIANEIKKLLATPWLPPQIQCYVFSHKMNFNESVNFETTRVSCPANLEDVTVKIPKELRVYYNQYLNVITDQPISHDTVTSSIIERNAAGLVHLRDRELELNRGGRGTEKAEFLLQKKRRIEQKMRGIVSKEMQRSSHPSPPSILESRSDGIPSSIKDSRFMLTEKLIFTKDEDASKMVLPFVEESKESLKQRQQEEEACVKQQIQELGEKLANISMQSKKLNGGIRQIEEQLASQQLNNQELSEVYRLKKTTFDLLPDADANFEKLQEVVEATAQRLVNLANQWENHRAPIVEQYRQYRELNANRVSETQKKLEEIVRLRENMKEIAEEAKTKEEVHKQLTTEYEKMTRDVNRSAYTRRILEIVTNIKKQKQDIDKVLIDTKAVQKEINQLSGRLERTFTVTDELIFKDAKKDNAVRKAYKYLAALHDNCSQLVKTVEETGIIMREIRDLEDQIENESQRKVLANLGRIMADYQQMKQENEALLAKLTGRTAVND